MRKIVSVVCRGSYFFAFCDDGTTWSASPESYDTTIVWKRLEGRLPLGEIPPQTPQKEDSKPKPPAFNFGSFPA
jgi:hypothetical protein